VSAKLKWSDTEEIGIRLHEKFPDVDPLSVRFTDLLRWISELEDFGDDPKAANGRSWKPSRWLGMRSFRASNVLRRDGYATRAAPGNVQR